jgi:hypothetical protein
MDGHQLASSDEADLQEMYRRAATAVISNSMASSIRLVFRREPHGTTIEPFLGSASFEALLGIAKKRDEAAALLGVLVECAFLFSEQVGVLLVGENLPFPNERTDLSIAAIGTRHRFKGVWYRIVASLTWFHFAQVEAKLLKPLKLSTGEHATHYFRDFWVRAVEQRVACDAVATMVAKDAAIVVAFGEVTPDEPPPTQRERGGSVITGGRVYFSDSGN